MDLSCLENMKNIALTVRAVNHNLRKRIMYLLEESESLSVTDIYIRLRIEQSVASQHLAILRRCGVLNSTREGKNILYSLNTETINDIKKASELFLNNLDKKRSTKYGHVRIN